YEGKSAHEVLAALLGGQPQAPYDIVRGYWRQYAVGDFEQFWRKALHDGVVAGTAFPPKSISASAKLNPRDWAVQVTQSPSPNQGPLEIMFRPDPSIFDGRFANNGWLQELPKPFTKLTWDNAALISPATAERLGLSQMVSMNSDGEHGRVFADVVELKYRGRTVRAPAWIVPGHPDDCVTVHLGYGRTRAGRVGNGAGFNAYALQTSDAPWGGPGLAMAKTDERQLCACTQFHHNMEGRHLLRAGTLAEFRKDPGFVHQVVDEKPESHTIYPPYPYPNYAWGMAIDINACIGCNACVIACQAENNIPVVGKIEVTRGREMHWIRIDRYYKGDLANPETYHQPVPCMQCENAPCELVCPVGATNHSAEGLNDQVYNRCVGTRYCSNNCPYKVRRFNFFRYADYETPSLKLLRNPDVTVRSRGVMEKCTYCVQRINTAKIQAENEDRTVRDGEIRTACQQACPTQAIVFGNINDPTSRVARLKAEPQNYVMLNEELNTRPRTSYLARLRNPNPELERG
ncbi:MAG TPA: 4Fe-4S dicluster domain-containing protein, partial [Candidatus Baltobacteraceae bacterium]|nr:4Fe-4S dicluster domain-containing protein [Candidatus Baltobacteraceae bacterium]